MFAAIFPGQGSQKPGMGRELFEAFAEARDVFHRVHQATGVDPKVICFELDEDSLRQTQNAQLALFTTGVAAFRCLEKRLGTRPTAMAGHSVGEYAAVVCAGYLSIEDGARLVLLRGELMAKSGKDRPGTMAAVLGLERPALEEICRQASKGEGVVVVANDNCPGQLVMSGDVAAVEMAGKLATEAGAKRVLPLNVSGAFHSPLMEGPAKEMGKALHETTFIAELGQPVIYCNVTSQPVEIASSWPVTLETQLKSPVRWTETIQNMYRSGYHAFVECGSGEVLSGLVKRIVREATTMRVIDPDSLDETAAFLSKEEARA